LASIPPFAEARGEMGLNCNVVTRMLAAKLASIPPFAEAKGGNVS
jgi:hypothetical protein